MRCSLTIPPNTTSDHPLSQVFYFTEDLRGEIHQVVVRIPRGHCYLAGLQVRTGRAGRVVPSKSSGSEWLVGDGDTITLAQLVQLDPPQYAVEMRGYNNDDTFPHTFYLDIE